VLAGLGFIGIGLIPASIGLSAGSSPPGFDAAVFVVTAIAIAAGCGVIIIALVQSIRGLPGAKPVAALVLDRSENRGVTVHLLLASNKRKSYAAVGRDAMNAYPGEVRWAFVVGGMLLGFERGPQARP
jgi:hypothetical protein